MTEDFEDVENEPMNMPGFPVKDAMYGVMASAVGLVPISGLLSINSAEYDDSEAYGGIPVKQAEINGQQVTYPEKFTAETVDVKGGKANVIGTDRHEGIKEAFSEMYEHAIQSSDIVFFENTDYGQDFWDEEAGSLSGRQQSENSFYHSLGEIAHEHDTSVVVADPLNGLSFIGDTYSAGLGAAALGLGIKETAESVSDEDSGMSRRELLRDGARIVGGSALFANSTIGQGLRSYVDDSAVEYGEDDELMVSLLDAQRAVNADAAVSLLEEDDVGNVSIFVKEGVADGVIGYLTHPGERERKMEVYGPMIGNTVPQYNPDGDSWSQVERSLE